MTGRSPRRRSWGSLEFVSSRSRSKPELKGSDRRHPREAVSAPFAKGFVPSTVVHPYFIAIPKYNTEQHVPATHVRLVFLPGMASDTHPFTRLDGASATDLN